MGVELHGHLLILVLPHLHVRHQDARLLCRVEDPPVLVQKLIQELVLQDNPVLPSRDQSQGRRPILHLDELPQSLGHQSRPNLRHPDPELLLLRSLHSELAQVLVQ